MSIRLLSLSGLPFLAAYYSKEAAMLLSLELAPSVLVLSVFLAGALFTLAYSIRFITAVWLGTRALKTNMIDTSKIHIWMTPLLVLLRAAGVLFELARQQTPEAHPPLIFYVGAL